MYIILNERFYDKPDTYAKNIFKELSDNLGTKLFDRVRQGKDVTIKYNSKLDNLDEVIVTLNKDKNEKSSFDYDYDTVKKLSINFNRDFFVNLLASYSPFKAKKKNKINANALKELVLQTLLTYYINTLAAKILTVSRNNNEFQKYLNSLED